MKKLIIFTDLDGTLLDHKTYSFDAARPALQVIKEKNIPLIICSSKTRKEIEHYRKKLDNPHPFISENGGGIYMPEDYSGFNVRDSKFKIEEKYGCKIIRLGAKYSDLRMALKELRAGGFRVKGFGDMTVDEISALTGLDSDEAEMAMERDFDEPFVFAGTTHELPLLIAAINKKGFNYAEGQLLHILGNSDKGKAVSILIDLFKRAHGDVVTIALGDSPNDVPMLERVDLPVIVKKHNGEYDNRINIPALIKADGIGPAGWNSAVLKLLLQE